MKYCKKCGMLLEDNMERCIGCGSDVKEKGSYSKYPEQVQEQIAHEKKQAGQRNLTVVAIILIFVVILLMVGIFASRLYSQGLTSPDDLAKAISDSVSGKDNVEDESVSRPVKDDGGAYYKYTDIKDNADHDIFHAVYPEDLSTLTHNVDYSWDSQVFPAVFSFIATNDENTAQLTYRSPQHYQYIKGTAETQVDIQQNVMKCISFYDFTTVEDYIKEMVKQAYPSAKKIEEMESENVVSEAEAAFDKIIKDYESNAEKELPVLFGLSEDTQFSHKDTYKSLKVMNYRILTKEDHAVSCKFYVPVFCEKYDFNDEAQAFSGTLSDCYILAFASYEAGSDELYDWYEDAFDIFINNSFLTDDFYKGAGGYAGNIRKSVSDGKMPAIIGDAELKDIYDNVNGNGAPDYADIKDFLATGPTDSKAFEADGYHMGAEKMGQIFIAPDKQLIYATKATDEYPGDDYTELVRK